MLVKNVTSVKCTNFSGNVLWGMSNISFYVATSLFVFCFFFLFFSIPNDDLMYHSGNKSNHVAKSNYS